MGDKVRVYVDIGGMVYTSTRTTLNKSQILKDTIDTCDENEIPFIDRDGVLFQFVLHFMRTGTIYLIDDRNVLQQLLGEAGFYGLKQMESQISRQLSERRRGELQEVVTELRHIKAVMKNLAECLMSSDSSIRRTLSLSNISNDNAQ